MSRVPEIKKSVRLEDVLSRGRADPTWRDRLKDWSLRFSLFDILAHLYVIAAIVFLFWGALGLHTR